MSSTDELFQLFSTEAEKLESAINVALTKPNLSIAEIIQFYYQTMNVHSLIVILKEKSKNSDENSSMIDKIEQTQNFISEKFDLKLHPSILNQLTNSISLVVKSLESGNTMEKPKEEIESEAKLYDKLRETMSTKEFVEQYAKGLSHD